MSCPVPEWSLTPFPSSIPSGGHIQKAWRHKMTTESFAVSVSSISWVAPSNLLLKHTRRNLCERFGPPPRKSPKEAADKLRYHPRKDPSCYPISKNQEPKACAPHECNDNSCRFSQTGQPPCHQLGLHPVIKGFWSPSIPRKLLGSQSNPKALVHLLTPRLFS